MGADFLGNISLKLVGLLVTVATMAAAYFFFVRPALDTTKDAIDSISAPIQQAQEQAAEAQQQLQQDAKQGGSGSGAAGLDLQKLQRCVQKAGQNVNALQRCTARFGPQ